MADGRPMSREELKRRYHEVTTAPPVKIFRPGGISGVFDLMCSLHAELLVDNPELEKKFEEARKLGEEIHVGGKWVPEKVKKYHRAIAMVKVTLDKVEDIDKGQKNLFLAQLNTVDKMAPVFEEPQKKPAAKPTGDYDVAPKDAADEYDITPPPVTTRTNSVIAPAQRFPMTNVTEGKIFAPTNLPAAGGGGRAAPRK